MPIKNSAKKAMRQTKTRTARNLEVKNKYKAAVKAVRKGIETGEKDLAEKLRLAQKTLGKAAKNGILKKNTASRKISRLAKATKKVAKK